MKYESDLDCGLQKGRKLCHHPKLINTVMYFVIDYENTSEWKEMILRHLEEYEWRCATDSVVLSSASSSCSWAGLYFCFF
jgi:hypothetical protein